MGRRTIQKGPRVQVNTALQWHEALVLQAAADAAGLSVFQYLRALVLERLIADGGLRLAGASLAGDVWLGIKVTTEAVNVTDPNKWQREPSEFGGYPGEVQPPPHELDSAELLRMTMRVDPQDADTAPEDVAKQYMATGGEPAAGTEKA